MKVRLNDGRRATYLSLGSQGRYYLLLESENLIEYFVIGPPHLKELISENWRKDIFVKWIAFGEEFDDSVIQFTNGRLCCTNSDTITPALKHFLKYRSGHIEHLSIGRGGCFAARMENGRIVLREPPPSLDALCNNESIRPLIRNIYFSGDSENSWIARCVSNS